MADPKAARLTEEFLKTYGGEARDVGLFFAPGRVNLIGEHTDYNGGYVLPAAISLGIRAAVRYTGGRTVRFRSADLPGGASVDLDGDIRPDKRDDWATYPKGVVAHLMRQGYPVPGCEVLFSGDLPIGAGLASSAALEVLTGYLLLYPSQGDSVDRVALAGTCRAVENEFVGVGCGIMDQFIAAVGKKDSAVLLNCSTLEHTYVPAKLSGFRLVIMDTGKRRRLDESKFNRRRAECQSALAEIRKHRDIPDLCAATLQEVSEFIADETLKKRARHVVSENLRTLEAARVLAAGDSGGFGRLLTESHNSLRKDYEVSGLELDTIVEEALAVGGCLGARMTGAGFGGCAIALVRSWELIEFEERVKAGYRRRTRLDASIYDAAIGDGVRAGDSQVSLPG
ncbi:MAG: galactokinase [Bacillota bacterium]